MVVGELGGEGHEEPHDWLGVDVEAEGEGDEEGVLPGELEDCLLEPGQEGVARCGSVGLDEH